jgi:hypothetical protein
MYLENKRDKRYIRGWERFRKNSNAGSTRELMSQVPSQSVIPVVSKGLSLNFKLVNCTLSEVQVFQSTCIASASEYNYKYIVFIF